MARNNKGTTADGNLTEEVLRQGGKSEDEVRRTGTIDRAEDEYERTLAPEARTVNSPVHKAVWDHRVPVEQFAAQRTEAEAGYKTAMARCKEIVKRHIEAGTIYGDNNKITDPVLAELAEAGYFGMLVDPAFGGSGASIADFMEFLTEMAAEGEATVAGLNSIHECIGAVDPLEGYGNDDQKQRYLPLLASGKRLSAFALTEPGAGSDLTAVRTIAVEKDDCYEVTGEKLFISNVVPGRIIGLVCRLRTKSTPAETPDHKLPLAVFIAELPEQETESFQLKPYGIHAVQHIYNQGILFTNFRVPKENLLEAPLNNGLMIAYHGLNRGRVALCANASGVMRSLLKSMIPWARFRKTYGQEIEKRELVKRRIARIAALIVGADALRDWCSSLLDAGYRGELECIIAKVFGADALAETGIKALKTHGGRSFLKGHIVGDNLHDLFAPSIYEGENEMLSMAFFKGLSKAVGEKYMAPMMAAMALAGVDMKVLARPSLKALGELFKLVRRPKAGFAFLMAVLPLLFWALRNEVRGRLSFGKVKGVHPRLQKHAKFARRAFKAQARLIYRNMLIKQLKLADEQDLMVDELSARTQKAVIMMVTCYHASKRGDKATLLAADVLCSDLTRELTGKRKTAKERSAARKLANLVVEGEFTQIASTPEATILKQYK
jgi:alkylation response protein AidB-like acyl-CoA dehydrogenase